MGPPAAGGFVRPQSFCTGTNGVTMKHYVTQAVIWLLAACAAVVPEPSAAQTFNFWSKGLGDTAFDQVGGVALDGFGNVYATGSFQGTVNFGGGNLVSAGERDVFLVKYAPDGTHIWSKRFGDADVDIVDAIAVDGSGNVVIAGEFRGAINFGGGSAVSAGLSDMFVAAFNASGTFRWNRFAGSTVQDYARAVTIDSDGNVIVTGGFQNTVDFGGGGLASAGQVDMFLVRYDNNGTHQWSQRFGGTGSDVGIELATDTNGDIVLGGIFSNTVNFGGGNLTSAGQLDIVLARYDASGGHLWSNAWGGTGTESMEGVSVGPSGDICITGAFSNTVDFGGGALVSAGSLDIIVAGYTSAGAHLWSRRFGNTSDDRGFALDRLPSGNIVVIGRFYVSVDFGGGLRTSPGNADIFVAELDPAGTYQADTQFGTAGDEHGWQIAADARGGAVIMGYYDSTIDFGSGPVSPFGGDDIFVARLADGLANPSITAITDVGNDEGREVQISFDRSVHDDAGSPAQVTTYEVYRRDDPAPALVASAGPGPFAMEGWTFLASAPAHGESSYSVLAPTIGDSTITGGLYQSVFLIRAATNTPTIFFDSAPDSGYSLDNLAPPAPGSVTYNGGTLSWDESTAPDFDYFSIYGSNAGDPSSATPLGQSIATVLNVSGSSYSYYFVTATDFAGNESVPGATATATGVGDTPGKHELSIAAHPNPFNPRTNITFTVPVSGRLRISIYDARGARIATLVDRATHAAGEYSVSWDGRNSAGNSIGSGVYFARIEHGTAARVHKLVLVK